MSLINSQIKPFKATAYHTGKFVPVSDADLDTLYGWLGHREVSILSRGYGKQHRLHGTITGFCYDTCPGKLPGWTACYGKNAGDAACITITPAADTASTPH